MVLQIVAHNYGSIRRNVSPKDINTHVEGFLLLRNYHKWGELYVLKGKERKLIRKFGNNND